MWQLSGAPPYGPLANSVISPWASNYDLHQGSV